jgi:hypothetical protein
VRKPKLDIRHVRVVNRPDKLKIRVYFPGVEKTYDFPTGAVMVYIDTDEDRHGPEYGHFMDSWRTTASRPPVSEPSNASPHGATPPRAGASRPQV